MVAFWDFGILDLGIFGFCIFLDVCNFGIPFFVCFDFLYSRISEFRNFGFVEFRKLNFLEFTIFRIREVRYFGISEFRIFGISEL